VLRGLPLQIDDAPRFGYRGLLLDSARHFLPLPALLRTLDAMAATKLNVLHWHLTDAESFPLTLPGFEDLAGAAWHPRAVYRPGDVAMVVEHARARGIRVVPEIDIPGHGAWRARPELLACADTLDPTQDAVYAFLADFLQAVTALFPDPYIFLGGDEVDVQACWGANATIAAWAAARNTTAAQLQPYFWRRVVRARVMHIAACLRANASAPFITAAAVGGGAPSAAERHARRVARRRRGHPAGRAAARRLRERVAGHRVAGGGDWRGRARSGER
jgi:hexosaminidase